MLQIEELRTELQVPKAQIWYSEKWCVHTYLYYFTHVLKLYIKRLTLKISQLGM